MKLLETLSSRTFSPARVGLAAWRFARLRIVVTCITVAALGAASSGSVTSHIFVAFGLCVTFNIHANSINDFTDRAIDAMNLPHSPARPLVAHSVTEREFWITHVASGIATLALSAVFGVKGFLLAALTLAIDYIYSLRPIRITNRTIASPIVLAAVYTVYPFAFGVWSTRNHSFHIALMLAIFCAFWARMLLKDFRDIAGDTAYGKRTFLLRYGSSTTCRASALGWVAAALIINVTVYPFQPVLMIATAMSIAFVLHALRMLTTAATLPEQVQLVNQVALGAHVMIGSLLVASMVL